MTIRWSGHCCQCARVRSPSPLLKRTFRTSSNPFDDTRPSSPRPGLQAAQLRAELTKRLGPLYDKVKVQAKQGAAEVSERIRQLELQRRLGELGGRINEATGYEEIERLRLGVGHKEQSLKGVRIRANELKKAYANAVALRTLSQREVNDLLQRKSSWSSTDVVRFTELVQQDHSNEQAEKATKEAMDQGEEAVEKSFSELMKAILERYHEEQVWSDKIRSLSTYGSLAITALNVLLFLIAIVIVEPWKRKRLVEGVETRLRNNTLESQEQTNAALITLSNLLGETRAKLDTLLPAPSTSVPGESLALTHLPTEALEETSQPIETTGSIDAELETEFWAAETLTREAVKDDAAILLQERNQERIALGSAGVAVGVLLGVALAWLGR